MALANITNNILTDSGVLVTNLTPTTRTLTINGTTYDLSADRSWSVGTHTGSLTSGYVPKATGSTTLTDGLLYDTGSAVLLGTQTAGSGKFMVYSSTADNHYQAIGTAPSFRFADTITSPTYTGIIGLATASNHFIIGAAAGDMVLANNTSSVGNFLFGTGATERMRINATTGNVSIGNTGNTYKLEVTGTGKFSGQLTLGSTITNGTYTYTLPSATGTIALTSDIPSGAITGSGTTNYLPKFTGTSTIGNSLVYDNGSRVGINTSSISNTTLTVYDGTGNGDILKVDTNGTKADIWLNNSTTTNGAVRIRSESNSLKFISGSNERLFLDASGNLGLGVTPSAWWASMNAIEVGAGTSMFSFTNNVGLSSNAYFSASGWLYKNSSVPATKYETNAGQLGNHAWYNAPSGTAGNAISFTQAMTLDASGNLSIGQTSSALQSGGTGITLYGASASEIKFLNSSTGSAATDGTALVTSGLNFTINNREAGDLLFGTSNTIRLTLSSTGAATFSSSVTATTAIFNGFAINQNPISAGTGATFTRYLNSGNDVYIGIENSASSFFGASAYASVFYMGSTNLEMFWSGAKRVTITNSGAATFSSSVTAQSLTATNGNNGVLTLGSATYYGTITHDAVSTGSNIYNVAAASGGGHNFQIGGSEKMRLTASGSLGIGTTSPNSKLEVFDTDGSGARTSPINILTITAENPSAPYNGFGGGLLFKNRIYSGGPSPGGIQNGARVRAYINTNSSVNGGTDLVFDTTLTGNGGLTETARFSYAYGNTFTSSNYNTAYFNSTYGQSNIVIQNNGSSFAVFGSGVSVCSTAGASDVGIGTAGGNNAIVFATSSSYLERMRITSGGDVCIASTSPVSTRRELRIGGNAAGSRISLGLNGTNYSALVTDSGGNVYLAQEYNDSAIKLLMINYNNGVYLSQSATSWTANSDERLKDINGTIENAVDKLNTLRAVNFSWKSDNNKKEVLGLIAQDVAKVFPQVIDMNKIVNQNEAIKDNTEYLGVRYTELVPVLVKAIQELKQELDTLKNK